MSLEEVTAALESARVSASGVSFAGKSLRLNTEDDAKPIVEEIDNCKDLQFLNLEGNTLGVEASQAIAKSLEKRSEFKRALWKDMFTGRMKTEIPKALEFLGNGLVTAGARLLELDLSDNAFGPIGVEGLASLLRSSSCYALEELRLNNNGLGITGGKLLAKALLDCHEYSNKEGKALALRVFIAGRNRLENEGAKALAEVFKTIGTLEEIAMPQNGIYHVGIRALSDAFKRNSNLQILNLNDNTIGPEGARAIADALPSLRKLREINLGDCLLKTKGAQHLAVGLQSCAELEQLSLGFNEIRFVGAKALISAMSSKSKVKSLVLDGNEFGSQGRTNIKNMLKEIGKLNVLGSLDEDVSGDSESEDTTDTSSSGDEEDVAVHVEIGPPKGAESGKAVPAEDFLAVPSSENFLKLESDRTKLLLAAASKNHDSYLDSLVKIVMKVSALTAYKDTEISASSMKCSEQLYQELFTWAQNTNNISITNNSLLVHLGLIKSEDKKFKPAWNLHGCLLALGNALKKNYIPESTKATLKLFLEKDAGNKELLTERNQVLSVLN